jgi:Protein of unknown function (DUF3754)
MASASMAGKDVAAEGELTDGRPRVVVKRGGEVASLPQPVVEPANTDMADAAGIDLTARHSDDVRETFIPVTKAALLDRLTHEGAWAPGQAKDARKFFQYLDYWRRQTYSAGLRDIDKAYEAFNPDSDLLTTRAFSQGERRQMQNRVVEHVKRLLKQANYVQVKPEELNLLGKGSHYGLELKVDLDAFEELLVFYRGRSNRKEERREIRKFYRKVEFEVPIFRRLFVLFKLKPLEVRVQEVMRKESLPRREAEKQIKKLRAMLPAQVKSDNIYMKLFKNMPRSDVEMIFPNTKVNFRMFDKVKLGVTGGAGLGMGVFGAAGKIALAASNPIAAMGAVAGLGGIAVRQGVNFMNQRQRYMVVMAQNLYFHAMADNRSAMIKLADRAAEEDVKEEMLLYSIIAKAPVHRDELQAVDQGIERYLKKAFDIDVDFDLGDALERLLADGLVAEAKDGMLTAMPPADGARFIDAKWDVFLDNLLDDDVTLGVEVDQ